MTGEDGSFYSSIDADSEGEEGKFYLWDYNELKKILNKNEFLYAKKVFKISKNKDFGNQIILKRRFEKNDNIDLFKKIFERH